MNEAAVNKDKSAKRRKRMFVKAAMPLMKTVVALEEIEKQVIREASKETLNKIRVVSAMFTDQTGYRIIFLQKRREKRKLMCMLH